MCRLEYVIGPLFLSSLRDVGSHKGIFKFALLLNYFFMNIKQKNAIAFIISHSFEASDGLLSLFKMR
jgi:uncharacterized membrane protein